MHADGRKPLTRKYDRAENKPSTGNRVDVLPSSSRKKSYLERREHGTVLQQKRKGA